jgi:hypothetical protein
MKNVLNQCDEIIEKTAKLSARHTHLLCLLVQKRFRPDNEMLLLLCEADWCVKSILAQMDEMESLFQHQQTAVGSEP